MVQLFHLHPEVWKIIVRAETGFPSSRSFPVQTAVGRSGGLDLTFCFARISRTILVIDIVCPLTHLKYMASGLTVMFKLLKFDRAKIMNYITTVYQIDSQDKNKNDSSVTAIL